MDDRADNSVTEQFKKDTEKLNQERDLERRMEVRESLEDKDSV